MTIVLLVDLSFFTNSISPPHSKLHNNFDGDLLCDFVEPQKTKNEEVNIKLGFIFIYTVL